jgi:hypothetical protein
LVTNIDIHPVICPNSKTLSRPLFFLPIDRLTSESHFPREGFRTKSNLSSETRLQAGSILDLKENDYQFETPAARGRSGGLFKPFPDFTNKVTLRYVSWQAYEKFHELLNRLKGLGLSKKGL